MIPQFVVITDAMSATIAARCAFGDVVELSLRQEALASGEMRSFFYPTHRYKLPELPPWAHAFTFAYGLVPCEDCARWFITHGVAYLTPTALVGYSDFIATVEDPEEGFYSLELRTDNNLVRLMEGQHARHVVWSSVEGYADRWGEHADRWRGF